MRYPVDHLVCAPELLRFECRAFGDCQYVGVLKSLRFGHFSHKPTWVEVEPLSVEIIAAGDAGPSKIAEDSHHFLAQLDFLLCSLARVNHIAKVVHEVVAMPRFVPFALLTNCL